MEIPNKFVKKFNQSFNKARKAESIAIFPTGIVSAWQNHIQVKSGKLLEFFFVAIYFILTILFATI